jgi:hypothetical protein
MMMKITLLFFLVSLSIFTSTSQKVTGKEIGIEGFATASSVGGNYSVGFKIGYRLGENIIIGPSLRLMHGWSKNANINNDYNIYGGGVFAHYRYGNVIFVGLETEVLRSPFNFGMYSASYKKWVPNAFIGGGLSREFREKFRLNVGILYDVINDINSPFRQSYKTAKTNPTTGQIVGYIPIIYRINIFIRFGDSKEDEVHEEEEL